MAEEATQAASEFVERSFLLPKRLAERIEAICQAQAKEPSEVVTEALRGYVSGGPGAQPQRGVAPSVASPATDAGGDERGGAPAPLQVDLDEMFGALWDHGIDSDELREGLAACMRRVEQKDHFINRHSESVARLAAATAGQLGLGDESRRIIEMAGLVHDIGKIRMPDEILGKKGRLTPEEWRLVRRYPEFGAEILSRFDHLEQVSQLVAAHQERWDGSGYPKGLQEEQIPLGAQIVAMSDVYHVLTSERAYRPALTEDVARKTLAGGIGRLWNPELGQVFLEQVLPNAT